MPRIAPVDPASAAPDVKPLLDAVQAAFGATPNLFRVAAQSPATLDALLGLDAALAKGRLGDKARKAVSLAVAEANRSDYCLSAFSALGKGAGLSDADIAAARQGRADDPKTAAVVRFARALIDRRGQVGDAEVQQLRDAGASDGEILETVGNTVFNILTNTINHVAGTETDFPLVRAGTAPTA